MTTNRFLPKLLVTLCFAGGCGALPQKDFPNRLIGSDGQEFLLEDILAIVDDPDLDDDSRRDQLHELGILDEDLVDALLQL